MSAYSSFAKYYDLLTKNVDYGARAAYFDALIRRYLQSADNVLDLACGTGSLAIEMLKRGYEMTGADASAEMLTEALQKTYAMEKKILFLHQAMDELDLYGTVDVTICALDSLNHVEHLQTLSEAFKRVALFTNPGGLFIFDVNTAYKHREVLGDNTFVYDLPEVFCVWQNQRGAERNRVDIALDFFAPQPDGGYLRAREAFSEWIYTDAELRELLCEAGFKHLQTFEGDTFSAASEHAERLVYVAKKI